MVFTSSSDDCPSHSSSDDHVHSPVIVLCNLPDVPGCLFDACHKQMIIFRTFEILFLIKTKIQK